MKVNLDEWFGNCGLELHPEKTKIASCNDADRKGEYPVMKCDFLGYIFCSGLSRIRRGKFFVSFAPVISNQAESTKLELAVTARDKLEGKLLCTTHLGGGK